jgi:hypothetical protein
MDSFKHTRGSLQEKVGKGILPFSRSRVLEEDKVPWFHALSPMYGDELSHIMSWIMIYDERFLKLWHPEHRPSLSGVSREAVLQRYKAKVLKSEKPAVRLLKDVVEIRVKLAEENRKRLHKELEGYGLSFSKRDKSLIYSGGDIRLVIRDSGGEKGRITGITLSLHEAQTGRKEYIFGSNSRLVFNADKTAVWTF